MSKTKRREKWSNGIGNQQVFPLDIFRPTTLAEIVAIIRRAESENCKVRAVGSGLSFSDIALTDDFLITTHGLNKVLPLDTDTLKESAKNLILFESECGITIANLNAELEKAGLALLNMGAHTAQTIVGALSTSTHGSGLGLGSLASFVKSIVIVATEGKVYRIEPTEGITDPEKYKSRHRDIELRQDDEWFNAVGVGLGCMGVVYSVTLQVREKYWLKETRTVTQWAQVKAELLSGQALRENRHYEVLINPYKFNGDHTCLVTKRNEIPESQNPSAARANRSLPFELLSRLPHFMIKFVGKLIGLKLRLFPRAIPKTIEEAIQGLADEEYDALSHHVLDLGAPNYVSAYSSELALPVDNQAYMAAAEKIIEIAERNRTTKNIYHTVPFSLRFVAPSDLYFSMMHGRETCMIEVPMIEGTAGGMEILREVEEALLEFSARPHWGQIHYLTTGNSLLRSLYPMFDKWVAVRQILNAKGTFNNKFSERCGFDR